MKERMVPAQQLSDAGEDLVRLAAAKDAEIAALTEKLDAATVTFDDEQAAHQDTLRLWQQAKVEIADLEQTVLHLQDGEAQTTLREMFPKIDAAEAEIAALTEQRDEAIAHSDNDRSRAKAYREGLRRLREQRDRLDKRLLEIGEALRSIEKITLDPMRRTGNNSSALKNVGEIQRLIRAALDAEAAAETAPSLPETP